ncbi:hypothetical protein KP509_18G008700 [Ceratopteris richardii]|uniref:Pentatricopeptide repeat-containing protein n=1 Tax=Ceratopteris richardii TaxID=49495 RepID=A0A8T2SPH6_CERRI|nr:hypothetical protein KP509_18G008700 [Ceratopteris richardii]KAH7365097.1 hypothetical protein KP509_18G008700 [Ceratopteris richardii]
MGNPRRLLKALEHMQHNGKPLWRDILYACTQSCDDLSTGRRAHSLVVSSCFNSLSVLGDPLIRLFGTCQSLFEANIIFCNIENPSGYTWQSIIWAHHALEEHERALELYQQMQQQQDVKPCKHIISSVLKSCGSVKTVLNGMYLHRETVQVDCYKDVVIGSCLIEMYAGCYCIEEARNVFDRLCNRNEIVWNVMIEGYTQNGYAVTTFYLFEEMQKSGISPGTVTLISLLKACQAELGGSILVMHLHSFIFECQVESDKLVRNTLIDMYARLGMLEEARKLFLGIPMKNAVDWGALISGYAQHGQGALAVEVFEDMQRVGLEADEVLFSSVLKGITDEKLVEKGMLFHNQIVIRGLDDDTILGTNLVNMYVKVRDIFSAYKLFSMLPIKNALTWSVMIKACSDAPEHLSAIDLFIEMQAKGIEADRVTYIDVLCAFDGSQYTLSQGRVLHSQIIEISLESDVAVANSLVRMLTKCGSPEDALSAFDGISSQQPDLWSDLISAYARSGLDKKALELLERTQNEGIMVEGTVLVYILRCCGRLGALMKGKMIHGQFVNTEYKTDVVLGNALLDMYIGCGALKEACEVFDEMLNRDLASWGTMMSAHTQHGDSDYALQLFERMQQSNLEPDLVSFSCALKACCNIGSIEGGRVVHDLILRSNLQVDAVAGNTLVDLYAKCGSLQDAQKVFDKLPIRNEVTWNSMITGYANHGSLNSAEKFLSDMQKHNLNPSASTYNSVFAVCGHTGQVKEGQILFHSMSEDKNIAPISENFNCMADNFARAGHLCEAKELLHISPVPPDESGWTSLLSACKVHSNPEIGQQCYKKLGYST